MARFVFLSPFVLAAGSQNLFDEDYTTGNLYQIEWLTKNLGTLACWIISAVGFGIVIFSILKNALSGLYVVNPNIWEKVDDIKKQLTDKGGKISNNDQINKIGGVLSFVLGLLPNVKALTDFEDGDDIDKKQYFMKSLPVCVAQIFIGMFIFFGYPSKIANWIGSAGTEVLDMVISNVDPVQFVSSMTTKMVTVKFGTDGSSNPLDMNVNEAAKQTYQAAAALASDISKDSRQVLAYNCESWLLEKCSSVSSILGAEQGYNIRINAQYSRSEPRFAGNWKDAAPGVKMNDPGDGRITYRMYQSIDTLLGATTDSRISTKTTANDYVLVTFECVPVALEAMGANSVTIYGKFGTSTFNEGKKLLQIPINCSPITYNGDSPSENTMSLYGIAGRSCSVSFIDKGASGSYETIASYQGRIDKLGSTLVLTFEDAAAIALGKGGEYKKGYCHISLNDTSKIKYGCSTTTKTIELNVTEFILKDGRGNCGAVINGAAFSDMYEGTFSTEMNNSYNKMLGTDIKSVEQALTGNVGTDVPAAN